jgi:hypothetical protein
MVFPQREREREREENNIGKGVWPFRSGKTIQLCVVYRSTLFLMARI